MVPPLMVKKKKNVLVEQKVVIPNWNLPGETITSLEAIALNLVETEIVWKFQETIVSS